jgi:ATP/maltotriose-dependent transcriptional regulator MalT
LVISIATVKRHISTIYAKLGAQSRTQAISLAKELGLFE